MKQPKYLVILTVGLVIAAALFTTTRVFPQMPRGAMGAMSFGMMRQMHAMEPVESEFDYLSRMIPHHQEAVDSARILQERTERAEMRDFAATIIETQSREIEEMEAGLERWYPDRSPAVDYEPMMRDYSSLSGDELDLAFLQDMIPHHMAAVMMSQQLLNRNISAHEEVQSLASTIRNAQLQEIEQMGRWMDRWFDGG